MKAIKNLLDKQRPMFEKGGKFEKLKPLFDAQYTFLFVPDHTTPARGAQIRDAIDLKRLMITVVIAMVPALIYGMWNVGHQHFLATGQASEFMPAFLIGLKVTLPIILVSYAAGGLVEVVFAIWRKHDVNEGFLVTGMLIPLVMPPTIPLWLVAISAIFAVVIAKEVFGGTGMNILNVALTARAFLYFAYPKYMAGSKVWVYLPEGSQTIDSYTGATALAVAAENGASKAEPVVQALSSASWVEGLFSFKNLFMGAVPGSIGETSLAMCLIGAAILIITGVGSWKIIFSGFVGTYVIGLLFNLLTGDPTSFMALPAEYHLVLGGLAFGIVFMATDPVSAAQTELGKWIYGFLIGALTVLIRVFNPAYPEGIMLAILFMNVVAPMIDYFIIDANKKRRLKRATIS